MTDQAKLRRYLKAERELKRADKRACEALADLIQVGDRIEWERGRGRQSGVVLNFDPYRHDLARVVVRSRTGKEYAFPAFFVTNTMERDAGAAT